MSTRGVFGFRIDGQEKLTYNHSDSYPSGLGDTVVEWVRAACAPNRLAQTMTDVSGITMVDDSEAIADADHVKRLGNRYLDMRVGGGDGITDRDVTWYRLLRNAQPSHGIEHVVTAGVMIRMRNADVDLGYIVDFDAMTVEFHCWPRRGEQATGCLAPHMTLRKSYPIAEVNAWRKTWERECFPNEDGEDE
ncbi:MAG TPA: hypothetical protein VLN57_21200 [Xanthobacteraceae bacterium]|nr:hypothetical protein [Xanthobacteraceae bacterium]